MTNEYNFEVKKATKKQLKARIAITGQSGGGKTYTALILARALAGEGGRVALIDTENRSASLYADLFDFDVVEFSPPFPPDKYEAGLRYLEGMNYDVIVIDSITHEWTGTGGCLEMVDRATSGGGNKYTAWGPVTRQHNAFVNSMVWCSSHLIVTIRSKMDHALEKDDRGKNVVVKLGMQPIQRAGAEYEFDIVFEMQQDHSARFSKTRCPALDGREFPLPGQEVADIILSWLDSGQADRVRLIREMKQAWISEAVELGIVVDLAQDVGKLKTILGETYRASYAEEDDLAFFKADGINKIRRHAGIEPEPAKTLKFDDE